MYCQDHLQHPYHHFLVVFGNGRSVLREMVLNAFVHADYFIWSNIKIEFFEVRCKITSPGGIFNASMDEIMKGTQAYRNHKLVSIYYKHIIQSSNNLL